MHPLHYPRALASITASVEASLQVETTEAVGLATDDHRKPPPVRFTTGNNIIYHLITHLNPSSSSALAPVIASGNQYIGRYFTIFFFTSSSTNLTLITSTSKRDITSSMTVITDVVTAAHAGAIRKREDHTETSCNIPARLVEKPNLIPLLMQ